MTQQEYNRKHHKTIWHIRHTVWILQNLYGKFKPCWVPYFCKMMLVLKVYPYMEVKQVCEALKDAFDSGLMENPGLTWEGDVVKLKDVNVPFDVFLDERFGPLGNAASSEARFGEDRPDEEQQQERDPEAEVLEALIKLSRQVEDVKCKVRKLIDQSAGGQVG